MFIPLSTYRLQFNKDFTFRQALGILDYLADLGISTIYASPILEAVPGSNHGYDVTDFAWLNPEIGTVEDLEALVHALHQKGMSWIQDIVPNHMNFSHHNRYLWDVWKKGEESVYASFFDIDWGHPLFGGRLLVPLLDRSLQQAIDDGLFQLLPGGEIGIWNLRFPLNERSRQWIGDEDPLHLAALSRDLPLIQNLLGMQHYLLAPYYGASREINYRRFFSINSLIGLRMDNERVFTEYHRLPLEWLQKGWIQGLRIDHIDGLKDPDTYLDRLRSAAGAGCYIVVEKILEARETLPTHWDIQGSTGYEFQARVDQVLTDKAGAAELTAFYQAAVPGEFADIVFEKKAVYLRNHMNGEWNNLVRFLLDHGLVAGALVTQTSLKEALGLVIACFPVYRVYDYEQPWIAIAFRAAVGRAPGLFSVLSQLEELFRPGGPDPIRLEFLSKLMQLTGAIAAKGVEDTTFYCYNALLAHNEVGDSPIPVEQDFHQWIKERQRRFPLSMNATSTHDSKRGEDARARLITLCTLATRWTTLTGFWPHPPELAFNDVYFIYQSITGAFPKDGRPTPLFSQRTKDYIRKALREAGERSTHVAPDHRYEQACMAFIDRLLDPEGGFIDTIQPFLRELDGAANPRSLEMVVLKTTLPGIPDFYQGSENWNLTYVDPDNRGTVSFRRQPDAGVKWFVTRTLLHFRKKNPLLFQHGEYLPVAGEGVLAYARRREDQWLLVVISLDGNRGNGGNDGSGHVLELPPGFPTSWIHLFTGEPLTTTGGLRPDQLEHRLIVLEHGCFL